ncbi:MAG: BamA/TamA family outer membrane protein [bacterium]
MNHIIKSILRKNNLLIFFVFVLALQLSGCAVPTIPPPFGKNKVITKQIRWYVAQTPHFEVYYYKDIEPLIPRISEILESTYERVTKSLDYEPESKTPFFVYATHNDFEQTNISDGVGEGVGGFAEAFKNRFVIPLTGSDRELEYVIRHEFTHIVTFEILYGGFWKSVRLLKSYFYPYWFMEGIAEYQTRTWDTRTDMIVRDAAISDDLIPLNDLGNFAHLESSKIILAYKQSQDFIRYLKENYGEEHVSRIAFEFKQQFDMAIIIKQITEKDIFTVNKEWHESLKKRYEKAVEGKKEPGDYGKKLPDDPSGDSRPTFSPDGTKIAFISARNGYNDIFVMNADGSNVKPILKRKIMRRVDLVHGRGHALSWSPDGTKIAFVGEKNQKNYIYIVDVQNKKLKKLKNNLDSVFSPCFSRDGQSIVFVGMKGGVNDLYMADTSGANLRQLNDDYYDDQYPVFSPDGKEIVYVSERNDQLDLFVMDTNSLNVKQITDTPFDEINPNWSSDGTQLIYINDSNHIYNLYKMNKNGTNAVQVTDVKGGNFNPEQSSDGAWVVFSSYREGEMSIYLSQTEELFKDASKIPKKRYTATFRELEEEHESVIISTSPVTLSGMTADDFSPTSTDSHAPDMIYPLSKGLPYSFKASTDLFYPLLFFSSSEGLYTAVYWQASELLGNHQLSTLTEYYSADDWLNLQIFYAFKKWRPQIIVGTQVRRDEYFNEDNEYIKSKRWGKQMFVSYPFDRFNRTVLGLHSFDITEENRDFNDLVTKDRVNAYSASLVRDITTGSGFNLTGGRRVNLTMYRAEKVMGANQEFTSYLVDAQNYYEISSDNIFALRLLGNFSSGPNKEDNFHLGGSDVVRGYPRDDYSNSKISVMNTESRFLIFPRIGYHMWYIIPDFYLKSLQGVVFVDTGLGWNSKGELDKKDVNSLKTSVGIGIRLNTFILEAFPFVFRLDYAKRLDRKDNGVVYFTIGPSF